MLADNSCSLHDFFFLKLKLPISGKRFHWIEMIKENVTRELKAITSTTYRGCKRWRMCFASDHILKPEISLYSVLIEDSRYFLIIVVQRCLHLCNNLLSHLFTSYTQDNSIVIILSYIRKICNELFAISTGGLHLSNISSILRSAFFSNEILHAAKWKNLTGCVKSNNKQSLTLGL